MRDHTKIGAGKRSDDLTVVIYERTRTFPIAFSCPSPDSRRFLVSSQWSVVRREWSSILAVGEQPVLAAQAQDGGFRV